MANQFKTLKPRIQTHRADKLKTINHTPGSTPRLRGRAAVDRRAAWLKDHPLCNHCDQRGDVRAGTIVDHVIPLWAAGADDTGNLQSLCQPDSDAKTAIEAGMRSRGETPTREQGLTPSDRRTK